MLQDNSIALQSLQGVNSISHFSVFSKVAKDASRSLIKVLNRTDPRIEPWGTLLVTVSQMYLHLAFTTSL